MSCQEGNAAFIVDRPCPTSEIPQVQAAGADNTGTPMNSISSIALSGLNAAQFRLDAAANNVANLQTPAYRRRLVAAEALPEGGVVTSVELADGAGENLAEDIVSTMLAAYSFKANLRTLQTEAGLIGSLLDTKA
jgi:hypothetical protein